MARPHVNEDMRPVPEAPYTGFDPVNKPGRQKMDVRDNMAPSLLDELFQSKRLLKPNGTLKIWIKTKEEADRLTDKLGRAALNNTVLVHHSEERIMAFLMQLIQCYDTDFHYTIGATEDQTKSTGKVKFIIEPGVNRPKNVDLEMKYDSAHHGTLPCIYAYPREEWQSWKEDAEGDSDYPGKPKAKVYLKHSDSYYLNNACTGLTKIINRSENTYLDGNTTEEDVEFGKPTPVNKMKLREFAIDLLNQAARKEIDPIQGLMLFMDKFQSLVKTNAETLPAGEKKDTFVAWNKELKALAKEFKGNEKWFVARLMGRYIPRGDREAINIEELVFPRHCKLIQLKEIYQNQTAAKVEKLGRKILAEADKEKKNVRTFDKALKLAILKQAATDERLQKFFQRFYVCNGQSRKELEHDVKQPAKDLLASRYAQNKIKAFLKDFSDCVHNYSIDESQFQSHVLKQIRKMRGLSLARFAEEHNRKFSHAHPLNHEQLRRIELGCVSVTPEMAARYAKVLKINERVFRSGRLTE